MSEYITAYSLAMAWDAWLRHFLNDDCGGCAVLECEEGSSFFVAAKKMNHAVIEEHTDYVREALEIQSATTAGAHSEEERSELHSSFSLNLARCCPDCGGEVDTTNDGKSAYLWCNGVLGATGCGWTATLMSRIDTLTTRLVEAEREAQSWKNAHDAWKEAAEGNNAIVERLEHSLAEMREALTEVAEANPRPAGYYSDETDQALAGPGA